MAQGEGRAEAARRKILESGDQELINRLHLMEATAPRGGDRYGPGLLGLGLAVAGGAWLGSALAGLTLSEEMKAAFAEVAGGLDGTGDVTGGADLPSEAGGEDLFGDFGEFFDI